MTDSNHFLVGFRSPERDLHQRTHLVLPMKYLVLEIRLDCFAIGTNSKSQSRFQICRCRTSSVDNTIGLPVPILLYNLFVQLASIQLALFIVTCSNDGGLWLGIESTCCTIHHSKFTSVEHFHAFGHAMLPIMTYFKDLLCVCNEKTWIPFSIFSFSLTNPFWTPVRAAPPPPAKSMCLSVTIVAWYSGKLTRQSNSGCSAELIVALIQSLMVLQWLWQLGSVFVDSSTLSSDQLLQTAVMHWHDSS